MKIASIKIIAVGAAIIGLGIFIGHIADPYLRDPISIFFFVGIFWILGFLIITAGIVYLIFSRKKK